MCHRFIRFRLKDIYHIEDLKQNIDLYIEGIKGNDPGFKFCKFKNDEELVEEQGNNPDSQFSTLMSGRNIGGTSSKSEKVVQGKCN